MEQQFGSTKRKGTKLQLTKMVNDAVIINKHNKNNKTTIVCHTAWPSISIKRRRS